MKFQFFLPFGEFILRAFFNGRLDLSQAENVGNFIATKSLATTDAALAGIQGGISEVVRSLRKQCMVLLTEIEIANYDKLMQSGLQVGHMIQAESDLQKRDDYLLRFMELPNQRWAEIITSIA